MIVRHLHLLKLYNDCALLSTSETSCVRRPDNRSRIQCKLLTSERIKDKVKLHVPEEADISETSEQLGERHVVEGAHAMRTREDFEGKMLDTMTLLYKDEDEVVHHPDSSIENDPHQEEKAVLRRCEDVNQEGLQGVTDLHRVSSRGVTRDRVAMDRRPNAMID
ncbi:hypothetical protein PInf_010074 [Phytophthora infestans]|nr:hypothetical protein PInf_010074 [Phytophthora infestans]